MAIVPDKSGNVRYLDPHINEPADSAYVSTAPTNPTNGQYWITSAGMFARINGVTVQVSPGWRQMTQAAYDALTPKDPNLLYVIVG